MKLMVAQKTASIAPTLGTKVSVASCTEVSACSSPITSPANGYHARDARQVSALHSRGATGRRVRKPRATRRGINISPVPGSR